MVSGQNVVLELRHRERLFAADDRLAENVLVAVDVKACPVWRWVNKARSRVWRPVAYRRVLGK